MTGETLEYKKHLSLQFSQCCQVHEEDTPHNSTSPWMKGAICLGPSGNVQGGYKFMTLCSAKKIIWCSWDAIPMPDTFIDRVNKLGKDQPKDFVFTDHQGRLTGDVKLTGVDGNEEPTEVQAPQQLINNTNEVEMHYLNSTEANQVLNPNNEAVNEPTQEAEPQQEI